MTFGQNSRLSHIGNNAFEDCKSLESVTFGRYSKLDSIGGYAFCDCSSLTSVVIPDLVTFIGEGAFRGCTALVSISFNADLTYLGSYAFASHTFYDVDGITCLDTTLDNLKGRIFLGASVDRMVGRSGTDGNVSWYIDGDTLKLSRSDV